MNLFCGILSNLEITGFFFLYELLKVDKMFCCYLCFHRSLTLLSSYAPIAGMFPWCKKRELCNWNIWSDWLQFILLSMKKEPTVCCYNLYMMQDFCKTSVKDSIVSSVDAMRQDKWHGHVCWFPNSINRSRQMWSTTGFTSKQCPVESGHGGAKEHATMCHEYFAQEGTFQSKMLPGLLLVALIPSIVSLTS